MSARALSAVESYVEARNGGDLAALLDLFGEDAILRDGGQSLAGHDDLRGYFEARHRLHACPLTIARLLSDGNVAMVELWRAVPTDAEERRHAVEVLIVDGDGLIQELNVYRWETNGESA